MRFAPLEPEVMERVVDKFIKELEGQLVERKVHLKLTPAARLFLAEKGYDPIFGARPLARVIQTELRDRLADEVLFGPLAKGGTVRVDRGEERLEFDVIESGA